MKPQLPGRRFKTRDSSLAYFVNQLENLDKRLYEPLLAVTWGRDIKLREGLTMGVEATSFIQAEFAGAGTLQNSVGNFPWISAETTAIPGVTISGKKVVLPLRLLAREVSYTSVELERSALTGQSIDVQKLNALNLLYQMNIDQMVYIGSADVGATGLANSPAVVASNVTGGTFLSNLLNPDTILSQVNTLLSATWLASAYAVCPGKLLLPPNQFAQIASSKVSTAGNVSVLEFIKQNSIALTINGSPLDIQPVKWLAGAGVAGADRMIAYTNSEDRVRYPMVPVRRETAYYQGIRYTAPYLWALGEMEIVYPETIRYADGV